MVIVNYEYEQPYLVQNGRSFPGLIVEIRNPATGQGIEVQAHLDSGAGESLFSGWIAGAIGLDLLSGAARTYASTHGASLEARAVNIVLAHPALGELLLRPGFSLGEIRRNLPGRDFFNLVQIGFQERWLRTLFSKDRT